MKFTSIEESGVGDGSPSQFGHSGLVHHVMARGIEGRDIFRSNKERDNFLHRSLIVWGMKSPLAFLTGKGVLSADDSFTWRIVWNAP